MGVEIKVDDLTKSFGKQLIWGDVTLTIPAGEICVMLGPSGTGKSVFLKTLIGLLKPDKGSILIEGTDIASCSERDLYEIRKLFGVLFQDGAMFGSMNLYDNVAFPLREHTKKTESEVRDIVMEKMDLVGLARRRGQAARARSPAACASAPAWPGRWSSTRRSSSSTSPTRASTRCAPRSSTSSSSTSTRRSTRRS